MITSSSTPHRTRASGGTRPTWPAVLVRAARVDASLYRSVQRPPRAEVAVAVPCGTRQTSERHRPQPAAAAAAADRAARPGLRMGTGTCCRRPTGQCALDTSPSASAVSLRHRSPPTPPAPQWRFLFAGLPCQPLPANPQLASVTQPQPQPQPYDSTAPSTVV